MNIFTNKNGKQDIFYNFIAVYSLYLNKKTGQSLHVFYKEYCAGCTA